MVVSPNSRLESNKEEREEPRTVSRDQTVAGVRLGAGRAPGTNPKGCGVSQSVHGTQSQHLGTRLPLQACVLADCVCVYIYIYTIPCAKVLADCAP